MPKSTHPQPRRPAERSLDPALQRNVLFEFHRVGAAMRVCAICPRTFTEVSVIGPATGAMELLKRTAMRKLDYVIRKKQLQKQQQARR